MSKTDFFIQVGKLFDLGFGVWKTDGTDMSDLDYYNVGLSFFWTCGICIAISGIMLIGIGISEIIERRKNKWVKD